SGSSVGSPTTAVPSGPSIASAWNTSALPPSSAAAQTATAVPSSTSWPAPSTPPAPQPASSGGASASSTPSSVDSGDARWWPEAKTRAMSQRWPSSVARARCAASIAPDRGSGSVDRPQPMRTPMLRTILPPMPGPDDVRVLALFGPTGVGKTAVAIAIADRLRARGERPVAVSADALQLYAGLEIVTGAATPQERSRLEHRLLGFLPIDARCSAGEFAELAHAEIDGLLAQGATPIVVGGTGLYLRAALAYLDLKPPAPPDVRARLEAEVAARGAPALHAELARRAPWAAEEIAPTDRQRIVRALELDAIGAL